MRALNKLFILFLIPLISYSEEFPEVYMEAPRDLKYKRANIDAHFDQFIGALKNNTVTTKAKDNKKLLDLVEKLLNTPAPRNPNLSQREDREGYKELISLAGNSGSDAVPEPVRLYIANVLFQRVSPTISEQKRAKQFAEDHRAGFAYTESEIQVLYDLTKSKNKHIKEQASRLLQEGTDTGFIKNQMKESDLKKNISEFQNTRLLHQLGVVETTTTEIGNVPTPTADQFDFGTYNIIPQTRSKEVEDKLNEFSGDDAGLILYPPDDDSPRGGTAPKE